MEVRIHYTEHCSVSVIPNVFFAVKKKHILYNPNRLLIHKDSTCTSEYASMKNLWHYDVFFQQHSPFQQTVINRGQPKTAAPRHPLKFQRKTKERTLLNPRESLLRCKARFSAR